MYKRILSLIINLISLPLYWFSFLVPRSKEIWVFGSWFGRSYTDNSKWLFESVCKNEPQIRAVWLTRERRVVEEVRRYGFEAYMINSWQGYLISCRAGLAVASWGNPDLNRFAMSRAKRLQLWHGSPIKKIAMDDKYAQDSSTLVSVLKKIWHFCLPYTLERWDVVIACSEYFRERMASAFRVHLEQVSVTGYPRNDILIDPNPPTIHFVDELKRKHQVKRIILYAPTFRNDKKNMDKLFDTFNIDAYENFLRKYNAVLLIKMHYVYLQMSNTIRDEREQISRIYWLKESEVPEINPLLNYTDILITDYSGVYFDYLMLDRPVILTPFDLEQYLAGDREMYDDYENFVTAGPMCKNWDEVMAECEKVLEGNDQYREERKAAQKKFNTFVDAKSCSRVIEVAKNMVGIQ